MPEIRVDDDEQRAGAAGAAALGARRHRRRPRPAAALARRLSIVVVLGLGQFYLLATGAEGSLVSIGLISFAAVAQLAPAVIGGLLWRGATQRGALAGLVGGFLLWVYTLPFPTWVAS